jgi:hypothetical protein
MMGRLLHSIQFVWYVFVIIFLVFVTGIIASLVRGYIGGMAVSVKGTLLNVLPFIGHYWLVIAGPLALGSMFRIIENIFEKKRSVRDG